MLLGEQLRRRHQRGLQPAARRARRGRGGNDRLAAADIALQQPHHGLRRRADPHRLRRSARACALVSGNGSDSMKRVRELLAVVERRTRDLCARRA